jgi:hypothetical protein
MSFADLIEAVDRVAMDVFGEVVPVVYAPSIGTPANVTGIFDENYVLAKGSADSGVEVSGPAAFFRLEDLPDVPEDDDPMLTIRSIEYRVIERRPDGLGGIVLVLRVEV